MCVLLVFSSIIVFYPLWWQQHALPPPKNCLAFALLALMCVCVVEVTVTVSEVGCEKPSPKLSLSLAHSSSISRKVATRSLLLGPNRLTVNSNYYYEGGWCQSLSSDDSFFSRCLLRHYGYSPTRRSMSRIRTRHLPLLFCSQQQLVWALRVK